MRSVLEEIKSRLDIVEVISAYIPLSKAGQNYRALCPFHTEKTPSFMVSPSRQIYHCFGCGSGGDIFTFLIKYENLSFQEAADVLAKKAGVTLKRFQKDALKKGERETLLNLHRDALLFYQQSLLQSPEAMGYLRKRGINSEAQRLFSLGYAPQRADALFSHLKGKGYELETIKKAGLVSSGTKGYYDTFRHRIIFPIFDLRGEVIAFGGRVINPKDEPKYLNSPETPIFNKGSVLYGLNLAKESIKKLKYAILAEGYFDVITPHMHGFSNTAATLGTALTQEHGRLIKRFVEDVVLVFDGDPAGLRAAKNALGILLQGGLNVKVLSLPEGEDPDSLLRKQGKEAFGDLLSKTLSLVDFFMLQEGDTHSIARDALEVISKIPNSILQGHYVKLLSERLKINELFIREELRKMKKASKLRDTNIQRQTYTPEGRIKSRPREEIYILQLLLNFLSSESYQPEKAERIFDSVSAEDFEDLLLRSIFKKMKNALMDYNALISECEEEERNFLTELSFKDAPEDAEKLLADCLNRLKNKKTQRLLHELQDRIKEAELKKDRELLRTIQLEQQRLLRLKRH